MRLVGTVTHLSLDGGPDLLGGWRVVVLLAEDGHDGRLGGWRFRGARSPGGRASTRRTPLSAQLHILLLKAR